MNVRLVALPILAVAALVWIGSASLEGQRRQAPKPATHTVTIDGSRFSPAELVVKAGDAVVWVNEDILAHTATSTGTGFDSKVIEPGRSWKFVAKTKGEFPYTCAFHPMNARLVVR